MHLQKYCNFTHFPYFENGNIFLQGTYIVIHSKEINKYFQVPINNSLNIYVHVETQNYAIKSLAFKQHWNNFYLQKSCTVSSSSVHLER